MPDPLPAKSPKLNALLIGKRTVPSGCRVLNVSQQGMSLHCDPDGRLLTFSSGDAVDIFLSVQHANGHNKFTIPAIVSHADESLIDVVFHCTDTELAGLIESYRTSESHNLEATIDHRLVSKAGNQARPVAVNEELMEAEDAAGSTGGHYWAFYAGLALLFIMSLILLGGYYYVSSITTRLNSLESISRTHTEQLTEVQSQVFSSRLQDGRYASLNARMKALTDAFQSFEKRISTTLLQGPPTAVETDPKMAEESIAIGPGTQQPDTIASKPASPETRTVKKAKPAQTAKPATIPPPPPEQATGAGKSAKSGDAVAGKHSRQKYPAIEVNPVTSPVTIPMSATTPRQAKVSTKLTPTHDQPKPAATISTRTGISAPASSKPASTTAPVAPGKSQSPGKAVRTPAAQQVADTGKPIVSRATAGPWVINLLSSPSKPYVEEMLAVAKASGYVAVITAAEVKGKQYWRLQLPGFDSMSAAKKAAVPVKDSLKIKDVWIFKRKR